MDDKKIINILRTLSIDMINEYGYGNPNMAISASSAVYTLFSRYLSINTNDIGWMDKDNFIYTSSSSAMLVYALFYLVGYDGVTLDALKNYPTSDTLKNALDRSNAIVDDSGISVALGLALGESYLAEKYNQHRHAISDKPIELFNHYTYVVCGVNDLINGASDEAMTLASALKLNKLIVLYISSDVTEEGYTKDVSIDNIAKKYEAAGWYTQVVNNMDDVNAIDKCITKAHMVTDKPCLIEIKSNHDKYFDQSNTHTTPLTKEEITKFKNSLGVKDFPFTVSEDSIQEFRKQIYNRSNKKYTRWAEGHNIYLQDAAPQLVAEIESIMTKGLKYDVISMYKEKFGKGYKDKLNVTNGEMLQSIAYNMPYFIGGSVDKGLYTQTYIPTQEKYSISSRTGKNILYGDRKSSIGYISNGLALCGLRPFIGCELKDATYIMPSIRQAVIKKLPIVYILTYDSITDGFYPVSELAMLRCIPNLNVYRPADANELVGTWDLVLKSTNAPSAIVVSTKEVQVLEQTSAFNVSFGAYEIRKEKDRLDGIIIASGAEVSLALTIANRLYETKKVDIRVISMPEIKLFDKQTDQYKDNLLPMGIKVMVMEFGTKYGLEKFVYNDKYLITLDNYIEKTTKSDISKELKLDYQNIESKVYELFK